MQRVMKKVQVLLCLPASQAHGRGPSQCLLWASTWTTIPVGLRLWDPCVCCQHCSALINNPGRHILRYMRSTFDMQLLMAWLREHCQQLVFHQSWNHQQPSECRWQGVTLAPWKSDCLLVWDVTFPDTFTLSYRAHATVELPGRITAFAECWKEEK